MSPAELSEKEAAEETSRAGKKAADNSLNQANEELKSVEKIIAESGVGTKEDYERLEEAKQKQKRAQDLVGMFEDKVDEGAKKAKEIKDGAEARGNAFATADTVSKLASIIGITTGQMAMVRKVRKESNKPKEQKMLEEAIKKLTDENKGEPKPEKEEKPPKA